MLSPKQVAELFTIWLGRLDDIAANFNHSEVREIRISAGGEYFGVCQAITDFKLLGYKSRWRAGDPMPSKLHSASRNIQPVVGMHPHNVKVIKAVIQMAGGTK